METLDLSLCMLNPTLVEGFLLLYVEIPCCQYFHWWFVFGIHCSAVQFNFVKLTSIDFILEPWIWVVDLHFYWILSCWGGPLWLDTFMLDQSIILIYVVYTCTGNMLFLLLVELYLSYILCIYLLCICISIYLAVVLYCRYSSCCCVSIYFYHGYS